MNLNETDKSALRAKSNEELTKGANLALMVLIMAAFFAFLAAAYFCIKFFAGGTLDIATWTSENWQNALLGLGIPAVITAAQAFLYQSGYKGAAVTLGILLVVFFSMFAEISQSMERADATVKHRSENSPVFRAAVSSIQSMATDNPNAGLAPQIADASRRLAQCEIKLRQGLVKHCNGDRAAVDTLREQSALASQGKARALAAAVSQAKALEYDEDKHYAMIRLIKDFLGISGVWANFWFSLIIIGTFEYAFWFAGSYYADHKSEMRRRGLTGARVDTQHAPDFSGNTQGEAEKKSQSEVDDSKAIDLIWYRIQTGEITSVTTRDDGQVALALKNSGIGKTNSERRPIVERVLRALELKRVIELNPEYVEGGNNGNRSKYQIVKNPPLRYQVLPLVRS